MQNQYHHLGLQTGCYVCQTMVQPPTNQGIVQTWTNLTRNMRQSYSVRRPIGEMPKINTPNVCESKALKKKYGHRKRMGLATHDPKESWIPPRNMRARPQKHTNIEFASQDFRMEESFPRHGVHAVRTTTLRVWRKFQIRHIQGEGNVTKHRMDNHNLTSQPKS